MKKIFVGLLLVLALVLSPMSQAKGSFGGSRSSGSFSSSRLSSFGGNRASSTRATIYRPTESISKGYPVQHTTVINNNSGGGNGFWNGVMLYSMFHHNTTVFVDQNGQQIPAYQPHPFVTFLEWVVVFAFVGALAFVIFSLLIGV